MGIAPEKKDREIKISLSALIKWAIDATVIISFISPIFASLWYFQVSQPMANMAKKIDQVQAENEKWREKINLIDKSVAVILERTERQEDSLLSIRRFLEGRSTKDGN